TGVGAQKVVGSRLSALPEPWKGLLERFIDAPDESYVTEDIHFIESRLEDYHSRLTGLAAELDTLRRYHRQTLQDLPMGVCSLAKDQEVLMWNRAIEELTGVGAQKVVGSRLSALPEPWKGLLERFIDAPD
ncbi:PAS domain-containing protein, partial [Klebsiella pneumoniae subsp. pneumoniae]